MRICVVGAGAIGGFAGAGLALGGHDVTFIARGANRDAINAQGLKITYDDGRQAIAKARATDDFAQAGRFDAVLLAVKAHQLGEVADRVESLCGPETLVLPLQNGIPFWYFHRHGGPHEGRAVESVDPGGRIARAIDPKRVIGTVVFVAAERTGPGEIRHRGYDRFPMGELDGQKTARLERLSQAFVSAGLQAPILDDVRAEVWLKLWGNVSFNPISALTGATMVDMCTDPHGRALVVRMMEETRAIAGKLGITFRLPIDKRIEGAARVGRHKTSMLQDREAGRPLELDALVGSVVELGELVGVPTPTIRAMYEAAKLLDRMNLARA
ncbi:MAG TPA: 2-dehydropantoate 2-reductase [Usitatibacter sp.]|nr:2-dehydropantoate 2-reductase [Usitatibacter sp.]